MGLIDVNIDKPARKREEETEEKPEEASDVREPAAEPSTGRGRRILKAAGALGVAAVGVVTLRKIRNRRREE